MLDSTPRTDHRARRGHSLLELIASVSVMTAALIPALQLTRRSLTAGTRVEKADMLATLCVSVLERHLSESAVDWTTTLSRGDFRDKGHTDIRFEVRRSEEASKGGLPDRLMSVTADVWHDANTNGLFDAGEPKVTLSSKLAKMTLYQNAGKE